MQKKYIKFIVSIIIGFVLLYYTLRFFNFNSTLLTIKRAKIDYLFGALLLLIIAYLIRGRRWMIWEKDLKYWDSFKLMLVGFMGNNILPARLGEILRAHCVAEKTSSNFGRTAALASIAIERVLDGVVIAFIGIVGLLIIPIDERLFWPLMFVCVLFFVITAGLLISIFFHQKIRNFMASINSIFPGHLTKFGIEKVNYFLDGLLLIRSFDRMVKALFTTAIIWGIELVMYYLIAKAVFNGISMQTCLLFLSVVNFASLFPLTVGGIGAIEGATTVYLISAGIPAHESLAMVLIQHAYQFFFTTSLGLLFYFTSRYYTIPLVQNSKVKQMDFSDMPEKKSDVVADTCSRLSELSTELGINGKNVGDVYLSIVIPAFNEQERLPKTLLETIAWCNKNIHSYEIIITDDGSSDDTLEIGRLFSEHDSNVKVIACPHLGKGATVRMGMLNSTGTYALFMDADGATPLSEIPKLIAKIEEGYFVAIGSRVIQNPGETTVKTSLHRKIIGRTFAALVNIFAVSGIADTQCGFKMFKKDIKKELFSRQKINGFAFDVELLYLANKLSYPVAEVPVNWVNQKGSKVNLITDSIKMFKDILKIRFMHRNLQEQYKESPDFKSLRNEKE